jgi:hypothetical protein
VPAPGRVLAARPPVLAVQALGRRAVPVWRVQAGQARVASRAQRAQVAP